MNTLFYFGFDKNRSFFDLFIGLYFWLGFWLKYTLRTIFENGYFDLVGAFNLNSGQDHDRVLIISSIAAISLLIATNLRRYFFSSIHNLRKKDPHTASLLFYQKYKKNAVLLFVLLAITIPALNAYFGIYQRGTTPRTILPFGLNGIFTWLVFFGLSAFFAVLLDFEIFTEKKVSLRFVFLGFLEIMLSNFSMLSRGMFLNGSALFFGINENFKKFKLKGQLNFNIKLISFVLTLMLLSILSIEYYRSASFNNNSPIKRNQFDIKLFIEISKSTRVLLVDRWVGIEGVMAVSSYANLGWKTLDTAWREKYQDTGTSWYDLTIIESPYKPDNLIGHHFITIPGIVAFLYYSGNYCFLFFGMLFVALLGNSVEYFTYRFGGNNLILCSIMSQVVAYRFIHFGYVPSQSYLLIGTIIGTVLIFYFLNKFLSRLHLKKP
ncbi:MAG: hypothetical protein WA160_13110 [Pseudobdellovibrio sp.]